MTMPTAIAYEPDKYAAIVLIGAGADFWLINSRSNYRTGVDALRIQWTTPPTEEQERLFDQIHLRHSPLDSYHTAKALIGKPIYMLHGSLDRAVPAVLGDLLWERLGKPRREVVPYGHELLFATLASRITEISSWLDEQVAHASAK
jgi:fermentation-respiration switch protein FrsA (DUF1100 family)